MNFSIHLPQQLLLNLDQFAKSHNTSRSSVVREAVQAYLTQENKSEWPADLAAWMTTPPDPTDTDDWPDFDAIRKESNASWQAQSDAIQQDLAQLP
jgi:Arc/MetJ-type ribon-helix-helix transcriptional regulator